MCGYTSRPSVIFFVFIIFVFIFLFLSLNVIGFRLF